MTLRNRGPRPAPRRCRDDAGTALVEFAFVSILLLTIVFAIISFGIILSFKQDLTRAAAEGARAAAVAYPPTQAAADADTATDQAVQGFDQTCGAGGLTCTISEHDCISPVPDTNDDPLEHNCIQVSLVFDYENHPLLVPVPLISAFLPDQVSATSDARVGE